MTRFFGLDLAGYSTGKSSLAEILISENGMDAIVYKNHPFEIKTKGNARLDEITYKETDALRRLEKAGLLLVDVPIDITALLSLDAPRYIWELTKRPVDYALGGLCPLADRLGASVARFRNLMQAAPVSRIMETYPAASLAAAGLSAAKYKKKAISWDSDHWVGGSLAIIAHGMRLKSKFRLSLSDDDVDAILCAYAGAAPKDALLHGASLRSLVADRLRSELGEEGSAWVRNLTIPENFQLFSALPDHDIYVKFQDWSNFRDTPAAKLPRS